MLNFWMKKLSQSRVTTVLCLLVLFTLLHNLVVFALKNAIDAKQATMGGAQSLAEFDRQIRDPRQNAAPLYEAAWVSCGKSAQSAEPSASLARFFLQHGDLLTNVHRDRARAQAILAYYAPALDMLKLAHSRSECSFNLHYELGFNLAVPNFQEIRTLCRVVSLGIAVARDQQDWEQANRLGAEGFRMLRNLEPDNTLITLMIRIALTQTLLDSLEKMPAERKSPELRAEAELLREVLKTGWSRALDGERLSAHKMYEELLSKSTSLQAVSEQTGFSSMTPQALLYAVGGQPMLLVDEWFYLDALQHGQGVPPGSWRNVFMLTSALVPNLEAAHKRWEKGMERLQSL